MVEHGEVPRSRRSLGGDRAAAASGAGASEGRSAADPGPGGADRHPVRATHRFAVGVPAAGDGMRLGDVVLATAA